MSDLARQEQIRKLSREPQGPFGEMIRKRIIEPPDYEPEKPERPKRPLPGERLLIPAPEEP